MIQTVRGMGNPILAIYAQMFLSRVFTSLDDISGAKTKNLFEEILQRSVLSCFEKIIMSVPLLTVVRSYELR